MIFIVRNNQDYGPYDLNTVLTYVNDGQILLQDKAKDVASQEVNTVGHFMRKAGLRPKVAHGGNLIIQLQRIGAELIIPKRSFINKQWLSDKKLLMLAIVGLFPTVLMTIPIGHFGIFYLIALYFSCIWGLFFYYLFKTSQVSLKTTMLVFFMTQIFVFVAWDFLGIVRINPFYNLTDAIFPLNIVGYTLGVGLTEELAKAIPLLVIYGKAKEPLLPQTMVYYGLMSGIAFGVYEGVQYQTGINAQLDYSSAFFMNIARLTSLPFLHAVWCGIAGYFIAFANLYPKYRVSLYFFSFTVPAVLHGLYDSLCGSLMILAVIVTFIGVILLMTYLRQGVNYQSKLRN